MSIGFAYVWLYKGNLDWGTLFVKSRVCYIKHLHIKNFQENYQNVHSIEL